jgi:putative flippase GtrA
MPNADKSILQFIRYALVGGFNTVLGYALFALFNWLFTGIMYGYMYASIVASLIAITIAFLGYKWFVFRTRGNYLAEWLRCIGVYGTTSSIGLLGLAIIVPLLRARLDHPERASYLAGAIMTLITVIFSFFAHRNISFREGWSVKH